MKYIYEPGVLSYMNENTLCNLSNSNQFEVYNSPNNKLKEAWKLSITMMKKIKKTEPNLTTGKVADVYVIFSSIKAYCDEL